MIDLHCHSIYSDGDKTPNELLEKAEKLKLKYFSITDHNNCFAYEDVDIKKFKGKLINGVELVTSFKNQIIEILGYGVNTEKINKWIRENDSNNKENTIEILGTLLQIFNKNNIEYTKKIDIDTIITEDDPTGSLKLYLYNDLLKYKNNKEKIDQRIMNSYSNFNKNGLNNPNSILFINENKRFPKIEEIVKLIHESGGLCFLAHIYQYNVENHLEFLDKILEYVHLDGVETYHSSFSKEQILEINKQVEKLKLYKSGGSDYHGRLKPNIELGLNLEISEDIIKPWIEKI